MAIKNESPQSDKVMHLENVGLLFGVVEAPDSNRSDDESKSRKTKSVTRVSCSDLWKKNRRPEDDTPPPGAASCVVSEDLSSGSGCVVVVAAT